MPLRQSTLIQSMEASNLAHTISRADGDMEIEYANPAFYKLTGYGPEEVIGRNCRFLQGPKTEPEAVARIRDAIAGRLKIELNLTNYRRDGGTFLNHLYLAPVFDDVTGSAVAYIGIQSDVTRLYRQFQYEQEHRNLSLLGRYSARINQEIRNALHPLTGVGETLLDWRNLSPAQIDAAVATLRDRLKAALHLGADLHTVAHGQRPGLPPVAVSFLSLQARQLVRNLVPPSVGLTIEARRIAGTGASVSVEARQFLQVVGSLVTHALDRKDGVRMLALRWDIERLPLSEATVLGLVPREYLRIDVEAGGGTDGGAVSGGGGDPGGDFPAMFSADGDDEGSYRLAVSRSIAGEAGGTVLARRDAGQGIAFTLLLPVCRRA